MPSTSKKQHNLMAAVAKNPAFAKKVGIKQSVGEEFLKADKGRKFGSGGRPTVQGVNKQKTDHGNMKLFKGGGMAKDKLKSMFKGKESYAEELKEAKAIKSGKITPQEYAKGEKMEGHKKGGSVFRSSANGIAQRGKTKGTQVKMCGGGMTKGKK